MGLQLPAHQRLGRRLRDRSQKGTGPPLSLKWWVRVDSEIDSRRPGHSGAWRLGYVAAGTLSHSPRWPGSRSAATAARAPARKNPALVEGLAAPVACRP